MFFLGVFILTLSVSSLSLSVVFVCVAPTSRFTVYILSKIVPSCSHKLSLEVLKYYLSTPLISTTTITTNNKNILKEVLVR